MADPRAPRDPRDPREPREPRDERETLDGRDEQAAERFDVYLDALLGAGRPSPDTVSDSDEAEMARLAAELAATGPAVASDPDPAFVEQLRRRMREADTGIAAIQTPPPIREPRAIPAGNGRVHLSRRELLQAGLGAAAGLAVGAVGFGLLRDEDTLPAVGDRDAPLVAGDGFWTEVASVDDVPPGTALRFSTAAFDGFVVNDGGEVRALSSTCTHMGCTLHFRPDWQDFRCPCHGASFDLEGRLANGRRSWQGGAPYPGDASAYPLELPDLSRPTVKVEDEVIWVWTAQV